MTNKHRFLSIAALLAACCSGGAHAVMMAPDGGLPNHGDLPPAAVVPATDCPNMALVSADAHPGDDKLDKYRFVGLCNINIAPQGKPSKLKQFDVSVDAEWSQKMKRASERITVKDASLTVEILTWATCNTDPFVKGTPASCSGQGVGASKLSAFLRTSDVPVAKGRANASEVSAMSGGNVVAPAAFYDKSQITALQGSTDTNVNQLAQFTVLIKGGNGVCPMEVDFGDGSSEKSKPSDHGPNIGFDHRYSKPGSYTVTAKSLAGCTGQASWKTMVHTPTVTALNGPPGKSYPGDLTQLSIAGTNGQCHYKLEYGDGKSNELDADFGNGKTITTSHNYVAAGQYDVKLTPQSPCVGSKALAVIIAPAVVQGMLPINPIKVGQNSVFSVTGKGNPCAMRISYGDGETQEFANTGFPADKGPAVLSHIYKKPGKHLVEAVGINGCVGLAAQYIQVD